MRKVDKLEMENRLPIDEGFGDAIADVLLLAHSTGKHFTLEFDLISVVLTGQSGQVLRHKMTGITIAINQFMSLNV